MIARLQISIHVSLFLEPVQKEVLASIIKWVGFFFDHVFDFSFPDMNNFISYMFLLLRQLSFKAALSSLSSWIE